MKAEESKMSINDSQNRSGDEDDGKQAGPGEQAGEDEGSSANEGREDHLKEDQKTTSR